MPAPIKGMSCSHCVYYEKTAENFGECRRYAAHPNACEFVPKINAVRHGQDGHSLAQGL